MSKRPTNLWRLLFIAVASLAFVGQPLVCHAENAGLMECHSDAHKVGAESHEPSDASSDGKTPGGCHFAGCHSPVSVPQSAFPSLTVDGLDRHTYPALDQILSDPPLSEIEHPPQLS